MNPDFIGQKRKCLARLVTALGAQSGAPRLSLRDGWEDQKREGSRKHQTENGKLPQKFACCHPYSLEKLFVQVWSAARGTDWLRLGRNISGICPSGQQHSRSLDNAKYFT